MTEPQTKEELDAAVFVEIGKRNGTKARQLLHLADGHENADKALDHSLQRLRRIGRIRFDTKLGWQAVDRRLR